MHPLSFSKDKAKTIYKFTNICPKDRTRNYFIQPTFEPLKMMVDRMVLTSLCCRLSF